MIITDQIRKSLNAIDCMTCNMRLEEYSPKLCKDCAMKGLCREVNTVIERDASLREAARS